jgi:hypothetical protein
MVLRGASTIFQIRRIFMFSHLLNREKYPGLGTGKKQEFTENEHKETFGRMKIF